MSICPDDAIGTSWTPDDGGRALAGYRGKPRDCVCRAIAIATGRPYQEIYDLILRFAEAERPQGRRKRSHPRTGVQKPTIRRIMAHLGWSWCPTMSIGTGCRVHLRADELPPGRLVVACSRHTVAVIDGVVHDTYDSTRGGTRCVYGYYIPQRSP
jgi:hypothetical protein